MTDIIDFHIHYTPEDMVRPNLGEGGAPRVAFQGGIPRYTQHEGLFRIDRHLDLPFRRSADRYLGNYRPGVRSA
jgi:hypothetical protein